MKPYSINLLANTPVPLALGGSFFLVDAAPSPFTVEFYGANNVKREEQLESAAAGEFATPDAGFSSIKLTSTVNQTVRFYIGRGRVGKFVLSGTADISDRAARLLGVIYGNLGQLAQQAIGGVNAAVVSERGFAYGAAFGSTTTLAANTNETIVAPGTNTNGLILWAGEGTSGNGGGLTALGALIAKSSAPASMIDGDVLALLQNDVFLAGATVRATWRLARPVFVAAGKGVYYRTDSAEGTAHRMLNYTVL